MVDAVNSGTIDLGVYLPVEAAQEKNIDFLVPYYQTTLGIALPKRNDFIAIAKGFFTMKFLYIVLSLSALLLVVAIVFWFLEREKNDDDFGGDRTWYEGIGASFWWAGVTLTTIGYGDKSPQSFGGRALAMLWMLVSLFVTATLTASLVSVFGSENVVNFPDDLKESKVMVVEDSPVADYLEEQSINAQEIKAAQKGLEALKKEKVDYFVHNTGSLRYLKKNNEAYAPSIQSTYKVPQAFAFGLSENQVVSDQLTARLHTILLSENWQLILKEYGLDYSVSE
jgi:ABC-type amino acid transport substrate-binding protein